MTYKRVRESFFWLGIAALTLFTYIVLNGTWWSTGAHARVVDAQSKRPIRDAIVLANWELKGLEGWVLEQVAFHETVTDAGGAFMIPGWGPRFRLAGTLRSDQPKVRVFRRGYEPSIVSNSSTGPWSRLLRVFFQHPSVDGQIIELQPFHGSPEQYPAKLEWFQQSIEFLYTTGNCDWQRAPRTVIEMHKLKTELHGSGDASRFVSLEDIADSPKCGSAREFLQEYMR